MQNIVLCCDGTANEFAIDRTSVVKLFFALDHGTARQVGYYVASLLHMYGLIPKGNEPLVPYAIRMMTAEEKGRFLPGKRTFAPDFCTC
jgi:hypothetical protein